MILVVAARELIRGYRLWLGGVIVIAASSAVVAAALAQVTTSATLPSEAAASLQSESWGVIAFSLLASITITSATTNLAIASGRRGYALLQLAGLLPRQVTGMVLTQLVMLAIVGTGAGVGLGRLIAQPLLDIVLAPTIAPADTSVIYGWGTVAWSFGLFVVVVLIAGVPAALHAGRVPPIKALREPEPPRIRLGAGRWVAVGISGAGSAGIGTTLALQTPGFAPGGRPAGLDSVIGFGMMFTIFLVILAVSLSPILYPGLMRAWTALIPGRLSGALFLARRSCRYRITQNTAGVTPLMVGIAIPGALYTMFLTTARAMSDRGGPTDINTVSIFTSIGPALFLAALGSAAVIFMTSRARARDNALVAVSGGTLATTALSALLEAVIYVVTAFLLAAVIFGIVGVLVTVVFTHNMNGTIPVYGVAAAAAIAGVGAVIVAIATVVPAISPTKRSIPSLLVAE